MRREEQLKAQLGELQGHTDTAGGADGDDDHQQGVEGSSRSSHKGPPTFKEMQGQVCTLCIQCMITHHCKLVI